MKKFVILGLACAGFIGCSKMPETTAVSNSNVAVVTNQATTVAGHSSEKSFPPGQMPTAAPSIVPRSETKTKWTQSGNPIDTTQFDAEIAVTEKNFKAKPADDAAKKALAAAYLERGGALKDASQYAAALGDYRKAAKLDPNSDEAKKWIDQIIKIYDSINRESPPEGEEPPALPFKKT